MKRIVINKPNNIQCKLCEKSISLYGFSSHIKYLHGISPNDYVDKFGEFRKNKLPTIRSINKIKCVICNKEFSSVGMFVHLRDSHNITPDQYINSHGGIEYRPTKIRKKIYNNKIENGEYIDCKICNDRFHSETSLAFHLKKHNISRKEYILKYYFGGINPLCKCGCGTKLKLLSYKPYINEYMTGHNNRNDNPMSGKFHTEESKKMMSKKAMERMYKDTRKYNTKPELEFKEFLNKLNIKYEFQYETIFGLIDFYLTDYDMFIEIDGEYWHPTLENLNLHNMANMINDNKKNKIENLFRIKASDINKLQCIEDIKKISYTNNIFLEYNKIVIPKEYFELYIKLKGSNKLKERVYLLSKFVQTFQMTFPYPTTDENLYGVIKSILEYDLNKLLDIESNGFLNTGWSVGNLYLKSHFKSYWKSSFKGNPSPVIVWHDKKIMKEIISYRIGCNTSGEVFDFSLKDIINGMRARRLTVSFFKPILAAAIYKHYLKDIESPIVLDPCCGFGGRLLGFKSKYPNGKYIGCEPNIETYLELIELVKLAGWTDVNIFNCKFEDYKGIKDVDLTFTSIPYFDVEEYSNNVYYETFDVWKNTFIKSIEECKNCYINTSLEIGNKLNWNNIDKYIINNRSHFDKRDGYKKEGIFKIC